MNRYSVKFSKEGNISYISHLDLLKVFKRGFKRAGISLEYSNGFNPHPKLGFAQPLSLGYWSVCELAEFETKENLPSGYIADNLKKTMPDGITIWGCEKVREDMKSLSSLTCGAEYIIAIPDEKGQLKDLNTDDFMGRKEIIVKKKSKKGIRDIDIKPMINQLTAELVDDNYFMTCNLKAGSTFNLSPELLLSGFMSFFNVSVSRDKIAIIRTKLFFSNNYRF